MLKIFSKQNYDFILKTHLNTSLLILLPVCSFKRLKVIWRQHEAKKKTKKKKTTNKQTNKTYKGSVIKQCIFLFIMNCRETCWRLNENEIYINFDSDHKVLINI